MSTLTIHNVPPATKDRLKRRAAAHGRSMEAELRAILADALADAPLPAPDLLTESRRRLASFGGVEPAPRPPAPEPTSHFDPG